MLGGLLKWLISYVLGGLSFVAILLGGGWMLLFYYGSKPVGSSELGKRDRLHLEQQQLEDEDERGGPIDTRASIEGWLTIRRQFMPVSPADHANNKNQILANHSNDAVDNVNGHHNPSKLSYSTRIAQTYRTIRGTTAKANDPPKEMYWLGLKGRLLYVYTVKKEARIQGLVTPGVGTPSPEHLEVGVVLDLSRYKLTIENKYGAQDLSEGKLFGKRAAMVLRLVKGNKDGKNEGLPMLAKGMSAEDNTLTLGEEHAPWFLFSKSPVKTEDWYFKILEKTRARPSYSKVWSTQHMLWFMNTVNQNDADDPSNLDWLNAFVGRIFLGVTHTARVEHAIIDRINRKLALITHPLIGPLVATEVNLGHIPPTFSKAMLKDLMGNGTVSFQAHMDYRQPEGLEGNAIRITIEATKLGFKAVLAVVVKSLSGDVEVKIKGPPSDRIWWAFTHPPKIDMAIEPIVGSRQINWHFILGFIEKKMREGIAETVVLPNMDDLPFFGTMGMPVRGGIFDCASKNYVAPKEMDEVASEDSASIRSDLSGKSDQSHKSAKTTETAKTDEGLRHRKRSSFGMSTSDTGEAEKVSVARSDTTTPVSMPPRTRKASSFKMFNSRPSSVRTDTSEGRGTNDTSSSKGFDVGRPDPPSRRVSIQGTSSSLHTSTTEGELSSMQSSTSDLTDKGVEKPDVPATEQPTPKQQINTSSIMSAVRARDKNALQGQAIVARDAAKDSLKKWGIGFVNKHRGKTTDVDENGTPLAPAPPQSTYYAPSPEDKHARTSLQDRLNAAAHTSTSPPHDRVPGTAPASVAGPPSPTAAKAPPRLPPRPGTIDRAGTEPFGTSPPTAQRGMVVPSMPKRPGVPTSISNDTAALASTPTPPPLIDATPLRKDSDTLSAPEGAVRVESPEPHPDLAALVNDGRRASDTLVEVGASAANKRDSV